MFIELRVCKAAEMGFMTRPLPDCQFIACGPILLTLPAKTGVTKQMIRAFPDSALVQLEFDKIKALLEAHCQTEYAKEKSQSLRVHTRKEFIELELNQTNEFKILVQNGQYFPLDYILNLAKELR